MSRSADAVSIPAAGLENVPSADGHVRELEPCGGRLVVRDRRIHIPGIRPGLYPAALLSRDRAVPVGRLSGDPRNRRDRRRAEEAVPGGQRSPRWLELALSGSPPGAARADLLARLRRPCEGGAAMNALVRSGRVRRRDRADHLDSGRSPRPTGAERWPTARRDRRLADPERLLNVAAGATWVSVHTRRRRDRELDPCGMVVVRRRQRRADERLERVLTADPGTGVLAVTPMPGYPTRRARRPHGLELPMPPPSETADHAATGPGGPSPHDREGMPARHGDREDGGLDARGRRLFVVNVRDAVPCSESAARPRPRAARHPGGTAAPLRGAELAPSRSSRRPTSS